MTGDVMEKNDGWIEWNVDANPPLQSGRRFFVIDRLSPFARACKRVRIPLQPVLSSTIQDEPSVERLYCWWLGPGKVGTVSLNVDSRLGMHSSHVDMNYHTQDTLDHRLTLL